jgi:septum formation protein
MLILGSQSKGRKKILTELGYKFETMSPNFDEKSIRSNNPQELALKLGKAKNDALKNKIGPNDILITSDQVSSFQGEIREKPINYDEAKKFLKSYSNNNVSTFTSVVVYNNATKKEVSGVDTATVCFDEIPDKDIQAIIDKKYILSCGGGFMIEDPILLKHITRIDGNPKSVMAMPPKLLEKLLEEVKD